MKRIKELAKQKEKELELESKDGKRKIGDPRTLIFSEVYESVKKTTKFKNITPATINKYLKSYNTKNSTNSTLTVNKPETIPPSFGI